jgi:hypothetical protein
MRQLSMLGTYFGARLQSVTTFQTTDGGASMSMEAWITMALRASS